MGNFTRHTYNIVLNCCEQSSNFDNMAKPAKTFKDLVVWQKAHRFVLATYLLTSSAGKSVTWKRTASQFAIRFGQRFFAVEL